MKHSASIRCLDLSNSRTKLALVDDKSVVVIYDLATGEATFEAKVGAMDDLGIPEDGQGT